MKDGVNSDSEGIDFLNQGGPSLELIRSIDWSKTSVGAQNTWPQSLRSALSICVNSNFPIAIYWGPDLVLLYNEAWSAIPGNKHPWAFGKTALEVWPDIWAAIEPQFEKAFKGTPGGSKDALLPMQRHGYTEECYFDFTFTPIYGDLGKVEGIFNAVIETTYRVISERRSQIIKHLTLSLRGLTSTEEVFEKAVIVLDRAKEDIPFFFVYENSLEGAFVLKAKSSNTDTLPLQEWPVMDLLKNGTTKVIENLKEFLLPPPHKHWPETPTEALIVPVKTNEGSVSGFIVGGISARRKVDKEYQTFYESLANTISGEINTLHSLSKERERVESLTQLDKAKTTFFSNISHEFRTPLTLMLSPLEEVLQEADNLLPLQRENLETSLRNSRRLQKLVNTLLDFSRIEAGKMEADFEEVDIVTLTRDLTSSFRSAIESSGLLYNVSFENIKSKIFVDIDMWEKIVLNLISNAFKYTETGAINIWLYEEDNTLIFKVSDTGIGITGDNVKKIFDRFYRVNTPGGRSQEGTGIGLALVKELVNLHNGEIVVESRVGEGSTFFVKIPATKKNSPTKLKVRESNRQTRRTFLEEVSKWSINSTSINTSNTFQRDAHKPKIVVADDNLDMRDYIIRLLTESFQVYAVSDGEQAFSIAQEVLPDLVLSDVMMPRLNGFELLEKLRSNVATRNIPFIFLSARAGEEAKVEGIQAGADDYLVKPFSAKELIARVSNQIFINSTRRKTEKEFFNLFNQSPAHIHVFKGADHVVEYFHPLGKKVIGRDITGLKIREALPEVSGQGYFEMLDDVFQNGRTITLPESKASLQDENGHLIERYFHITYHPWRGLDGNIQGVLQFSLDMTDQVTAILKIKESEERFRVLSNSIPQFVWIADVSGQVEYMSDQWEKYAGTSPADGQKLFASLIHPDDIDEVRLRWENSMKTKAPWTAEFRLKNVLTGAYRWFIGHTVPLLDENGEVLKWIGSSSDIHTQKTLTVELERIVAERTFELTKLNDALLVKNNELLRAQNFLQTVLDSSVELVTAFDIDLNYTFVNKRLTQITTRDPEQLIGKNILEIEPGFEKTEGYKLLNRALSGETIHIESRRSHIDDQLIFETFVIPLKQNGDITGVVTMQRDITTIVKLTEQLKFSNDQLQRSNEDLQQFAHVTSHDLKEPVRKIKMYGDILNTDFSVHLPVKGKGYLAKIEKAASRISTMIDGVLQYSMIDALDQSLQEIELNVVIENIIEDLEISMNENNAKIHAENLPTIKGYPTLMYQLFYNLINNSLKFRRKDVPPKIILQAAQLTTSEKKELGDDYFKITLEDNGIGFEQNYSEKIFESFTRLYTKDQYEGTGLGLALCKKIVIRHRGVIKACGELNRGATFNIYLPKSLLQKE